MQASYATDALDTPEQVDSRPVVTLTPDDQADVVQTTDDEEMTEMEPVRWQAHEYIHHEKGVGWFFAFSIVVVLMMVVAIFVIRSLSFAILIPVMAAALVVYSHRPPRLIDYTLSGQGLHVNDRLYAFAEFRAFGIVHDDGDYSVMLLPTKRFRPGVAVYFPKEAGEAIVDMLGARLPLQEFNLDLIDRVIRKLRI